MALANNSMIMLNNSDPNRVCLPRDLILYKHDAVF